MKVNPWKNFSLGSNNEFSSEECTVPPLEKVSETDWIWSCSECRTTFNRFCDYKIGSHVKNPPCIVFVFHPLGIMKCFFDDKQLTVVLFVLKNQ